MTAPTTRRALRLASAPGEPVESEAVPSLTRRELRARRLAQETDPRPDGDGANEPGGVVATPGEKASATYGTKEPASASATTGTITRRQLREQARAALEAGTPVVSEQQAPPCGPLGEPDLTFDPDLTCVATTLDTLTIPSPDLQRGTCGSDAAPLASAFAGASVRTEAGRAVVNPAAASLGPVARTLSSVGVGSGRVRRTVPRLAVLSALGAATVVVPVVASAQTDADATVPLASESALDTLRATRQALDAAADSTTDAAMSDTLLVSQADRMLDQEDLVAAGSAAETDADGSLSSTGELLASSTGDEGRLAFTASRSVDRTELPRCGEPTNEAAPNGSLAALESTEYVNLVMPIRDGDYRVSSYYGPRWGSIHTGTDFAAELGTPIHSVSNGTVIYAGGALPGRSPNIVVVESVIDGAKVQFWYNHMYADGVLVSVGDQVSVGDVIAKVGSNGNSTGPHLHFEVHTGPGMPDPNDATSSSDFTDTTVDSLAWLTSHGAVPLTADAVCA